MSELDRLSYGDRSRAPSRRCCSSRATRFRRPTSPRTWASPPARWPPSWRSSRRSTPTPTAASSCARWRGAGGCSRIPPTTSRSSATCSPGTPAGSRRLPSRRFRLLPTISPSPARACGPSAASTPTASSPRFVRRASCARWDASRTADRPSSTEPRSSSSSISASARCASFPPSRTSPPTRSPAVHPRAPLGRAIASTLEEAAADIDDERELLEDEE